MNGNLTSVLCISHVTLYLQNSHVAAQAVFFCSWAISQDFIVQAQCNHSPLSGHLVYFHSSAVINDVSTNTFP